MIRPLRPCGTYPAYVRHRKYGEPVDVACLEAQRVYKRAARRRAVALQRLHRVARSEAMEALVHRHAEEYAALLACAMRDLVAEMEGGAG